MSLIEVEVEFRDGLHGGLVWAVGIVIGAAMLMATAGAVARTGAEVAGKAAASVASTANPMDLTVDTLLQPMAVAQAGTPAQGGAAGATTPSTTTSGAGSRTPAVRVRTGAETRAEISRILARSTAAAGEMSAPDRAYLTQLVAQRTGISQQEAEKRVADAITAARDAADKARRGAILTGFVTAASLHHLTSSGMVGGHQRRQPSRQCRSCPVQFCGPPAELNPCCAISFYGWPDAHCRHHPPASVRLPELSDRQGGTTSAARWRLPCRAPMARGTRHPRPCRHCVCCLAPANAPMLCSFAPWARFN